MQNRVSPELRRNTEDRVFFGVASGLADYFGIDVALTRVLFVVTAILGFGTTLLVYLVLAILVPDQEPIRSSVEPGSSRPGDQDDPAVATGSRTSSVGRSSAHPYRTSSDAQLLDRRRNLAGWIVVVLGVVLLASNMGFLRWLSFGSFWPVLLIALGAAIILGAFRRQEHRD